MSNVTFDDLFACRMHYQDFITDENTIIRYLKKYLKNNGTDEMLIDDTVFNFYTSFEYPISFEEIKNIKINNITQTILNDNIEEDDNNTDEYNHNNIEDGEIFNNLSNNINIQFPSDNFNIINLIRATFMNNFANTDDIPVNNIIIEPSPLFPSQDIFQNMIQILNTMQSETTLSDVVVTTNEDDINELKEIIVSEKLTDKCSICMMNIMKDDTILDIKCKHNFHKDCLLVYLKKYNHICPICRQDIGKSNAII